MNSDREPEPSARKPRRFLFSAIKLGIIGGLLYLVFMQVQVERVLQALADISPMALALGFALSLVAQLAGAWRWHQLLGWLSVNVRFRPVLKLALVSNALGTFLPPTVGRDAFRVYYAARFDLESEPRWTQATVSVVADRAIGVAFLSLCCLPGLALLVTAAGEGSLALAGCTDSISLQAPPLLLDKGLVVLFVLLAIVIVLATRRKLIFHEIPDWLRRPGVLEMGLFLLQSVIIVLAMVLSAWALGLGLEIAVPLREYLLVMPLILVLSQLPITFLGLGTREAGLLFYFGCSYASREEVLALSVCMLGVGLLVNLCGAIISALKPLEESRENRSGSTQM